jgi:anti-sigma factor RsiW
MPSLNDEDRETLTAYLDGELDDDATQELEARLGRDDKLRAELESMRKTWGLLDFLPKAAPSADFTHRTMDRLTLGGHSTQTGVFGIRWPVRRAAMWIFTCFAALGVGGGVAWAYRHYLAKPIDPDEALVHDLRLLERLPAYENVEDLEFLKALDQPELFGDDG